MTFRTIFAIILIISLAGSVHASLVDVYGQIEENGTAKIIVILKNPVNSEFKTINGFSDKVSEKELDALAADPNVKAIQLDKPVHAFLAEAAPQIGAPTAWNLSITGKGETVCVVDTGVDYTHPALAGRYVGGYDFVNNDSDPMDDNGHGTHVAGIIASNDSTYRGIAPEANIAAVKVLDADGSGYDSDVIAGIDWCVSNSARYNITVISMSLGGGAYSSYCDDSEPAFSTAINAAVDNNISVIVASGNSADYQNIAAPACIQKVTSVGAVYDSSSGRIFPSCYDFSRSKDKITCYTNRNSLLDLLAPGSSITSTWTGGTFKTEDGTSMATPMVSAAVALLHQYNAMNGKTNTPEAIENRLKASGKNITDFWTGLTFPRINVGAALNYDLPAVKIASPANITYNNTLIDVNYTASGVNCRVGDIQGCRNLTLEFRNFTNSLRVYTTDMDGNTNFAEVNFTVDVPHLSLESPASILYNTSLIDLNFTVQNISQIDKIWYILDNATNYVSSNTLLNVSEGAHELYLFANVTGSGMDSRNVSFRVGAPPALVSTNTTLSENLTLQASFESSNTLSTIQFIVDGRIYTVATNVGAPNTTATATINNLTPGTHNYTWFVNDSAGNWANYNFNYTIPYNDTIAPFLYVTSPASTDYSASTVALNFTVSDDAGIDSCWYVFNGASEIAECANTTITAQTGANSLTLYVNDTSGNTNSSSINFTYTPPTPPQPPSAPATTGGGGMTFSPPAVPKTIIKPQVNKTVPNNTAVNITNNSITKPKPVQAFDTPPAINQTASTGMATATNPFWLEPIVAGIVIAAFSLTYMKMTPQVKRKRTGRH